jgi:glycosyltransferase involved in cell wall biosynthesis
MPKKKLLFIYPNLYTFIQTEIDLLSDDYDIISITQNWSNKILLPFNLLIQFFFLLYNLPRVKVVLISFAGYSSFLPCLLANLLNKKVLIVAHGTDCVSFPEINYGNLRNPLLRFFTKISYQCASKILPVSESLVYTENNYFSSETLKFGYTHHLSNITTPFKVIPNAINSNFWNKDNTVLRDKRSFLTVLGKDQALIKGLDLIIELANEFPDCKFYIAGIDPINNFKSRDNIFFKGRLSPDELRILYCESQFYLQLSNSEGFGVALCEAMLCKCIPIVSNVNVLPEIIGNSGFVLKKRDLKILIDLINIVLECNISTLENKSRDRIKDNYTLENRKQLLLEELSI